MIGIYAGRFQPFHLGHLGALRYIMSQCTETFVCICSKKKESPLDDSNPFEFEERKTMIERSLGVLERPHIKHIHDQENDEEWTRVIEKEMPKGRKVSFSNNPHTTEAFRKHGYETRSIPIEYNNLNATLIRKKIIRNEPWIDYVPMQVWYYIQKEVRGFEV